MIRAAAGFAAMAVAALWVPIGHTEDADSRSADAWLALMNRAFVERNYDGVFSYFDGADLSTLRVVHSIVDGEQRERLVHLNGARREIVRRGDDVACVLQPGDEMLALEASIPSGPFARAFTRSFEEVSRSYELSLQGTDRIADRHAVILHLVPREHDRYGYRLWLDRDTGLLLRSELVDMKGTKLEIFQFAQIAVDEPIDADLLDADGGHGAVISHLTLSKESATRHGGRMPWHAAWVPNGFEMAAWDIRRTPSTLKPVNTLMYSDGLAAFSVFIEDMPKAGAATFVSRNGATVAVTHLARGPADEPYLVTVVGELPVETAQRVARSVSFASE